MKSVENTTITMQNFGPRINLFELYCTERDDGDDFQNALEYS